MTTPHEPTKQVPTWEEVGQARAYMTGVAHGFAFLFEQWTGWPDGTAVTPEAADGTRLIFTGDELYKFDVLIPCTRHQQHRLGINYPDELTKARQQVSECSASPTVTALPPLPRRRPRVTPQPSPLHVVSRFAEALTDDRGQSAS